MKLPGKADTGTARTFADNVACLAAMAAMAAIAAAVPAACPPAIEIVITRIAGIAVCVTVMPRPAIRALSNFS